MATAYPPSTPKAGWHPIHGLLAAYPIACFTGAFLTDIAYAETYNMQWANFSIWLITAGLVMGVLAAVVGIVDFVANRRVRAHRPGWFHSVGNALVLLLSLWNAFVHSRDGYTSVVPTGIILSGIVAVLVLITAWIGNSIVYRQQVGEYDDVGLSPHRRAVADRARHKPPRARRVRGIQQDGCDDAGRPILPCPRRTSISSRRCTSRRSNSGRTARRRSWRRG